MGSYGLPTAVADELLGLLKILLVMVEERAVETYYGPPMVDDPRSFLPDSEVSTPSEIEIWKMACDRANRGEEVSAPRHVLSGLAHAPGDSWGLGVTTIKNTEMAELADRIRNAIALLEQGSRIN